MLTEKQKDQLMQFRELGINTMRFTYEESVDIIIEKYLAVCDALEYDEKERFKKEIRRIQQPNN